MNKIKCYEDQPCNKKRPICQWCARYKIKDESEVLEDKPDNYLQQLPGYYR